MQLFRKINVSDVQKPKICVVVMRFRADDLLSGERSILQSAVGTDIQRPSIFKEVLFYIRDESALFKKIIVTVPRLISLRTVFDAQPNSPAILLGVHPSLRRV